MHHTQLGTVYIMTKVMTKYEVLAVIHAQVLCIHTVCTINNKLNMRLGL